jgi:AraC-like DNA-binding protein
VEEIASEMNLSRVQLYRKVKALTGSSPVELMRKARLSKAYRLLLSGDKNISEVAYEVGFSAPSYFTKCFKDEFGVLPGDVRSRM